MAWKGVITNSGSELLAQWTAGKTLTITRAAAGTGRVSEAAMLAQTALVSEKQTVSILSNKTTAQGQKLQLQVTPLATGYPLNQLGIWAKLDSGAARLIALFQTDTDAGVEIPSKTDVPDYTDSMPYHTGTTLASRDSYGIGTQYRYIEGLWDNVYDWGDGCYYNSNGLNIINTPSSFSDNSGGTAVGVPSSGWPSAFTVATVAGLEWVIYPTASGGSETTYSADVWDFGASSPCLCFGGSYNQGGDYGLFYVSCAGASNSYANVGCRLQKLP